MCTALALGVAGGAIFAWLRLPLPWMLGPMSANMAASLGGARIDIPASWRWPMLGILGVLIGSVETRSLEVHHGGVLDADCRVTAERATVHVLRRRDTPA